MSASQRKLTRLPFEVFENLISTQQEQEQAQSMTPEELRSAICDKLKRFRVRSRNGGTTTMSLKTVGDLLMASPLNLLQALDPLLTYAEIQMMLQKICQVCSARPVTCLTLLKRTTRDVESLVQKHCSRPTTTRSPMRQETVTLLSSIGDQMRFLPTGLETLDCTGGIRLGSISEVLGRAGAGKTQFALQLMLMAAKYNQGTIYIDTENKLILGRLKDMATQRWSEGLEIAPVHLQRQSTTMDQFSYGMSMPDTQDTHNEFQITSTDTCNDDVLFRFKHPDQVLHNITVKQPKTTEELLKVLETVEEEILHRNQEAGFPVRVLIVDSIAAPLRRDFGTNAVPQRAATAFSIAQTLKRYAEQLHLAVIVINQAGLDSQSGDVAGGGEWQQHDQMSVRAALGTSWHHCVSSRILLQHKVDPHRDDWRPPLDGTSQLRILSVVKSNWMPFTSLHFEIRPIGIVEVRRPDAGASDD